MIGVRRTNGLDVFIGREIERGPAARESGAVGPIARMAGHYVLDRKVTFQCGESIGTDANPMGCIRLDRTSAGMDSEAACCLVLVEAKDG